MAIQVVVVVAIIHCRCRSWCSCSLPYSCRHSCGFHYLSSTNTICRISFTNLTNQANPSNNKTSLTNTVMFHWYPPVICLVPQDSMARHVRNGSPALGRSDPFTGLLEEVLLRHGGLGRSPTCDLMTCGTQAVQYANKLGSLHSSAT